MAAPLEMFALRTGAIPVVIVAAALLKPGLVPMRPGVVLAFRALGIELERWRLDHCYHETITSTVPRDGAASRLNALSDKSISRVSGWQAQLVTNLTTTHREPEQTRTKRPR